MFGRFSGRLGSLFCRITESLRLGKTFKIIKPKLWQTQLSAMSCHSPPGMGTPPHFPFCIPIFICKTLYLATITSPFSLLLLIKKHYFYKTAYATDIQIEGKFWGEMWQNLTRQEHAVWTCNGATFACCLFLHIYSFKRSYFTPHIFQSLSLLVLIMTLIVHFHSILCVVLLFSCTLWYLQ